MRKGILSGTVTYQEPSPLPPNAVLRVWVWDTAEPAESSTVGEGKFPVTGPGPLPFEIFFDPALIQGSHVYVTRASISVGGVVRFESAEPVVVLTQGASSVALKLVVQRVAQ
ncbi:MAG: YbaY family lipoprotein [Myxococcaceae bacterium]